MKVLITGGYGFIGSFVAERFFKEGYDVFIIDNLASGKKENVDFKHRSYQISVEDYRKCEEVFHGNSFDAVIYLASQGSDLTSLSEPQSDIKTNVLGLINILTLAHKYNARKFIYASSIEVYGQPSQGEPVSEKVVCNPVAPYGISKWIGEIYCRKWHEMYGLDTVCFRMSNVYGPRQRTHEAEGLIASYIEKAVCQDQIVLQSGQFGHSYDFIYVEDVADAMYRASYSNISGTYNLCSKTSTPLSKIIGSLEEFFGSLRMSGSDRDGAADDDLVFDNSKIKRDLDWVPLYRIDEGLLRTFHWHTENRSNMEVAAGSETAAKPILPNYLKLLIPYIENASMFLLAAFLSFQQGLGSYIFLDFKLFYIIIIGVIHGNRQSFIAFLFAAILHFYQQVSFGRDLISLLYDTDLFFQLSVYLFISLVVGYTVDRRRRQIRLKEMQLKELEEKHHFLNQLYTETREIKDELQQQIMNNEDSFGKIYSITKELESLEPEKIFTSTVGVLESIMKTKAVAIYTVNPYRSYLRLVARSKSEQFATLKSIKVEDVPYLLDVLHDKKMYINMNLTETHPLISAPVINNGETVAIIMLYDLKFENFNLYYQNLFKVSIDLISSALSRALSYVEITGNLRYVEGTSVLKPDVFEEILTSKRIAKEKHNVEFVLLAGDVDMDSKEEISQISNSLRENDYLGMDEQGRIRVLLSNSTPEDAAFVLDRFSKKGIHLMIVEEDL